MQSSGNCINNIEKIAICAVKKGLSDIIFDIKTTVPFLTYWPYQKDYLEMIESGFFHKIVEVAVKSSLPLDKKTCIVSSCLRGRKDRETILEELLDTARKKDDRESVSFLEEYMKNP